MTEYYQLAIKLIKQNPIMITMIDAEKCGDHYYKVIHTLLGMGEVTEYLFGFIPFAKDVIDYRILKSVNFDYIQDELRDNIYHQVIKRNPFELEHVDPTNITPILYQLLCEHALKLNSYVFRYIQKDYLKLEDYIVLATKAVKADSKNLLDVNLAKDKYNELLYYVRRYNDTYLIDSSQCNSIDKDKILSNLTDEEKIIFSQ